MRISKKDYGKGVISLILLAIALGFALPELMSAKSDVAVAIGAIAILASFFSVVYYALNKFGFFESEATNDYSETAFADAIEVEIQTKDKE